MQRAIFPILKTWESQPMGTGSHKDTKALDFGVLSPYKDTKLTAPFDGKVVFVDTQANGGGIAFESLEKVKYVDGTEDYMTLWTGHDNTPPKLGAIYKQGEHYSDMGTAGGVAIHCHLEVIKGKFKMTNKVTSVGAYKFDNTIEPYKALFLNKEGLIKYSKYKWTTLPDTVGTPVARNEYVEQIEVIATVLRARKQPSLKGEVLGYMNQGIYNIISSTQADGYTWYQVEENVWIAYDKEWETLLPRTKTEEEKLKEENAQLHIEIEQLHKINEELCNKIIEFQQTNQRLNDELIKSNNKLKEINRISTL